MIYIGYSLFLYKDNRSKYLNEQEEYLNIVKQKFPGEEYLLPYSRQTRSEIAEKLKCDISEITGTFLKDLKPIISRCKKMVLFPTRENYIGLGMYWEILMAQKYSLEILMYNKEIKDFTSLFQMYDINNNIYGDEGHIFYKKIKFD